MPVGVRPGHALDATATPRMHARPSALPLFRRRPERPLKDGSNGAVVDALVEPPGEIERQKRSRHNQREAPVL